MKLLITGGGFIARAIMREYPSLDVTLMSRSRKPGKWIKGEVTSFRFPDEQFTHIIHAPLFLPPFCHYEAPGFRRVQEYARRCGAKLLYVSSGIAKTPYDEYSLAKAATEKLAEFDYIVRPFAFVGPDLVSDIRVAPYAIMDFIKESMEKGSITITGNGRNIRSWKWQGDMAREMLAIMEHGERGVPYDIGSFERHTIKEGADLVAKLTCSTVLVLGSTTGVQEYLPDYNKMFRGGLPCAPLEESIKRTIACLNP